jgi:hypothetical protein
VRVCVCTGVRVCQSDTTREWECQPYSGVAETLFKGDVLGLDADVSTGDLRVSELRKFGNVVGCDFHIPERFSDKFATHVVKNMLTANNPGIGRVPLILAIWVGLAPSHVIWQSKHSWEISFHVTSKIHPYVWGGKGCGKSFNVELCCRELGVTPIVTSAGELEDPTAGEPGALLRRRYLAAAKAMRETGRLACMVINDLDAGVGRFKDDNCTVNNQIVQATLMNLCDEPTRVSVGVEWRSDDRATCARVPIIVTGNDMSRLYAPLTRSGRMDLWMWEPDREELVRMVHGSLKDDEGYEGERDAAALVAAFPEQPLDFFGAARSRCVDDAVRAWVESVGIDGMGEELMRHRRRAAHGGGGVGGEGGLAAEVGRSIMPENVSSSSSLLAKSDVSLEALMRAGTAIAQEQQNVLDVQLARQYVNNWAEAPTGEDIRTRRRRDRAGKQSAAEAAAAAAAAAEAEAARSPEVLAAAAAARDTMLDTMAAAAQTDGERRTIAIGAIGVDGASEDNSAAAAEDDLLWWGCLYTLNPVDP